MYGRIKQTFGRPHVLRDVGDMAMSIRGNQLFGLLQTGTGRERHSCPISICTKSTRGSSYGDTLDHRDQLRAGHDPSTYSRHIVTGAALSV